MWFHEHTDVCVCVGVLLKHEKAGWHGSRFKMFQGPDLRHLQVLAT